MNPQSVTSIVMFLCAVGGVPMPRVQRSTSIDGGSGLPPRSRSMSMEEADLPRGTYSMSPPKFDSSKLSSSPPSTLSSSPTKS